MRLYEFDLILSGVTEIGDDLAELLFVGGCDDATPVSRDGVAWLHFDRTAGSLEEATRSAVAQVQKAGLTVAKVELDLHATASLAAVG